MGTISNRSFHFSESNEQWGTFLLDTLTTFNGQEVAENKKVCTLCEEFASQTLDYLSENKTQTEILEILHNSCSQLHSFKQKVNPVSVSVYNVVRKYID